MRKSCLFAVPQKLEVFIGWWNKKFGKRKAPVLPGLLNYDLGSRCKVTPGVKPIQRSMVLK